MRLLLVEDEKDLSMLVKKALSKFGYAIDCAYDGEMALYQYEINKYDCILLDLNLPKIDGLEVLKTIRKKDKFTKIIILSARSSIEQRVLGLDLGANDYLCKPFDILELDARIRTLIRINYQLQNSILKCGKLEVDTGLKKVKYDEIDLLLTKKEYGIVECLILKKGEVLSPEVIINHVWNDEKDLFSNSLKFHLNSLKNKLLKVDGEVNIIVNVRGHGYKLVDYE